MPSSQRFQIWVAPTLATLLLLPCCKKSSRNEHLEPREAVASVPTPKEVKSAAAPPPPGTPVIVAGRETGYLTLSDGSWVRRQVLECPNGLPRSDARCPRYRISRHSGCTLDAECTTKPNGFCASQGLATGCKCEYGCTADVDCGLGRICVCTEPVGYCADSSCGSDGLCATGECKARPLGVEENQAGPFSCVK
jgi:hypothetical protein